MPADRRPSSSLAVARRSGPSFLAFLPSFLLGCCLACTALPLSAQRSPRPPQRIEFQNTLFYLAFSSADHQVLTNEYIPVGETLEDWTRLIALRIHYQASDPVALMEHQEQVILDRFPDTTIGKQVVGQGAEARMRFVVSASEPDPFFEFNLWRFQKLENTDWVRSYQFAFRQFTGDREAFHHTLEATMNRWTASFLPLRLSPPLHWVDTTRVEALEKEAVAHIRAGELGEGMNKLLQTVSLDPQNARRRLNVAAILFNYGKTVFQASDAAESKPIFSRAEQFLRESIRLYELFAPQDRMHAQAWFLIGEIQFYAFQDYENAVSSYQRAIALDPLHQQAKDALSTFSRR